MPSSPPSAPRCCRRRCGWRHGSRPCLYRRRAGLPAAHGRFRHRAGGQPLAGRAFRRPWRRAGTAAGRDRHPFRALDVASFTAEAPLDAGTRIGVRRDGQDLAQWTVATQADAPPRITFAEQPGSAQRGLAIRLPWRAEDDWGVAAARAEITLAPRPDAPPLALDLPISGDSRQPRGMAQPDLSAHPWAGLPVRLRLVARDSAGQEGRSDTAELTLPERRFEHPVARRLVALRKSLSMDPLARQGAERGLDELSLRPEDFENDLTTFMAMRSARYHLTFDRRPEAVEEAQALMWQTAIALEEGRTNRTARALAEAREALREALAEAERQPPMQSAAPSWSAGCRNCVRPSASIWRPWPSSCSARMARPCRRTPRPA
ncbi:DUF4175 family protein [Pseudoroseomonas wenyumeiae]